VLVIRQQLATSKITKRAFIEFDGITSLPHPWKSVTDVDDPSRPRHGGNPGEIRTRILEKPAIGVSSSFLPTR
jgi:hypothetical protein